MKKRKIGLVLGSGGVRGLAHIGVLKQLETNKIPIDYIAGASIGSLIGAFYAAWGSSRRIEEFAMKQSGFRQWLALVDLTWKGGLMVGNKIEKLLREQIGYLQFSDLKIPLTLVATDLHTGKEIHLTEGDVIKAVRASIASTPVFTPIQYDEWFLADGGLTNPVPDDVVRAMGADVVISVSLDTDIKLKPLSKKNITDVTYRALSIIRHNFSDQTVNSTDILIEPQTHSEKLVGFNDFFNKKTVQQNILAGEKAAKAMMPEILRKL
ncbi:MAG: patatin-like phospholipase family protein [Patescibacteria group bacterium]|nr:patatin-like phospholipase family protein [Patescibacteria group bacterium]